MPQPDSPENGERVTGVLHFRVNPVAAFLGFSTFGGVYVDPWAERVSVRGEAAGRVAQLERERSELPR